MRKQIWAAIAALMVVCGLGSQVARGQAQAQATGKPSTLSLVGGNYVAYNYVYGGVIVNGNSATGSQTDLVCFPFVLPDGRPFNAFNTNLNGFAPLQFDPQSASAAETVTPSAISIVATPPANAPNYTQCYNITATFANTHASGSNNTSQVISGDFGLIEALNDASFNGGGQVFWQIDCGNVTLNTGGATTTTTCNVPATFTAMGGSAQVKTTITTAASYSLGVTGATTAFFSTCTSLTAGQNCSQFVPAPSVKAGGTGLLPLLITANVAAGAGAVHVKAWGYTMANAAF